MLYATYADLSPHNMAKLHKYGVSDLRKQFPSDKRVAEFLFDALHSRRCSCGGRYKPLKGRRQFQCSRCGFQIAPTAGTIFHKSNTPLTLWFTAILLFSNAKSGYSAKQLERDINVGYKTAWRMLNRIRGCLGQGSKKLQGDVEVDQAYVGGVYRTGKNKNMSKAFKHKSLVMGAVERGGKIRVKVVPNTGADTQLGFVSDNVEVKNTRLMTDKTTMLKSISSKAYRYDRHTVNHEAREYVRGEVHINSIESFWSHFKRSTKGVQKVISKKHLSSYLDAFVFHYNNRHSDRERFSSLLDVLLRASK